MGGGGKQGCKPVTEQKVGTECSYKISGQPRGIAVMFVTVGLKG